MTVGSLETTVASGRGTVGPFICRSTRGTG